MWPHPEAPQALDVIWSKVWNEVMDGQQCWDLFLGSGSSMGYSLVSQRMAKHVLGHPKIILPTHVGCFVGVPRFRSLLYNSWPVQESEHNIQEVLIKIPQTTTFPTLGGDTKPKNDTRMASQMDLYLLGSTFNWDLQFMKTCIMKDTLIWGIPFPSTEDVAKVHVKCSAARKICETPPLWLW